MTTISPEAVEELVGTKDDLDHIVCSDCNENLAFCGLDVTNAPWADNDDIDERTCVVCVDLDDEHEMSCPYSFNSVGDEWLWSRHDG